MHTWLLGGHILNDLYDYAIKQKLDGTCDWILERPEFTRWASSEFPAGPKLLWIRGAPGFGKTILCARVIQALLATPATPTAYFFFSSDFESRSDPTVAIRAWVSQLMSHDRRVFNLIYERWAAQQEQFAGRELVFQLLRALLQEIPGCTLILDGLDECISTSEHRVPAGSYSVRGFLQKIKREVINPHMSSRIMIVSRDIPEIRDVFLHDTDADCAEYQVSPEDVQADTASYSRSIVNRQLSNKPEATKSDISQRMSTLR